MNFQTLVLFLAGLALLMAGAEALVRGASRLASALGISPLVIGLTVVAFGTSSPELAVNLRAGWTGASDIAVGSVVGSNISNLLFILGLSALIRPLVVAQQLVRLDVPLLIGASVLLYLLSLDGRLGRIDGAVLFAGIVGYTALVIGRSMREAAAVRSTYEAEYGAGPRRPGPLVLNLALALLGLAMLTLGARWLVDGAVALAHALGLGEFIIGLTIVAVGTSLPELATSVVAGLRGERDIAVGNLVGSSLFNVLGILGISALVAPHGIQVTPAAVHFDIPVMIGVSVACLPVFFTGHCIFRWEGGLFLAYYVVYVGYLVLGAAHHDALPLVNAVMGLFVLPLTGVTLAVFAFRAWRGERG
jgi:cation:H+ antiporter